MIYLCLFSREGGKGYTSNILAGKKEEVGSYDYGCPVGNDIYIYTLFLCKAKTGLNAYPFFMPKSDQKVLYFHRAEHSFEFIYII